MNKRGTRSYRLLLLPIVVGLGIRTPAIAQESILGVRGNCDPCDTNCDSTRNELDVAPFVDALINELPGCATCSGDANLDGVINGNDLQPFVDCLTAPAGACCLDGLTCLLTSESACPGIWLGAGTSCQQAVCAFANLMAYRPQHGTGYFPFSKTAVAENQEEDALTGPGIRINTAAEIDPQGEDDLIEVLIENTRTEIPLALARDRTAIRLWTTRTKTAGTEIAFVNNKTSALQLGPGGTLTIWIEWADAAHGIAQLRLEPLSASAPLDSLLFHSFHSIMMSLGGENQPPSVPVDPNHGTFLVGINLYLRGYDVHMYDEDNVIADGSGPVYDEAVNAIRNRSVEAVSIFGYSHGGGSTHDLSERLDNNRAGIGVFEILATSYVDGVENDSDIDVQQELRHPPSSAYHANHYQVGAFSDFFLDGGPVPNSDPPPTGRNMEGTQGGQEVTHFLVDDYPEVRNFIEANLAARVAP